MMIETVIRENLVYFEKDGKYFEAHYVNPAPEGPVGQVVNENKWILSELVLQGHRSGRPIKRVTHKRRRRPKRIGVFNLLSECREHIELLKATG